MSASPNYGERSKLLDGDRFLVGSTLIPSVIVYITNLLGLNDLVTDVPLEIDNMEMVR